MDLKVIFFNLFSHISGRFSGAMHTCFLVAAGRTRKGRGGLICRAAIPHRRGGSLESNRHAQPVRTGRGSSVETLKMRARSEASEP
jgi:hypothetical protein